MIIKQRKKWPAIDTLWIKEERSIVVKSALKGMFSSEELLVRYIEINKGILDRIEDILNEINDEIAIWGIGHHAMGLKCLMV